MNLYHRTFGIPDTHPLLLLHGLLGSSQNWIVAGKALGHHRSVCALDLRNHGLSPHAPSQEWDESVEDILRWMDRHAIPSCALLGHSLGGKVAMRLACRYPERVSELLVVEVAPRQHPPRTEMFSALLDLDLTTLQNRRDAEKRLQLEIADTRFLRFLLTNLERTDSGSYRWRPNLQTLAHQSNLFESGLAPEDQFEGPTRFLVGAHSDYVRPQDHSLIQQHFPHAKIQILSNCSHTPHTEQPAAFIAAVIQFLEDSLHERGIPTPLLHLTSRSTWDEQHTHSTYLPTAFETEGFIHCSTRHQILEVAQKHFRNRTDLLLLCIDPARLQVRPIWENLEGGLQPFPHLYGPIEQDAIYAVLDFPPSADGTFELPPIPG